MKNNRAPPTAPAIIGMDNSLSVLLPVEVPTYFKIYNAQIAILSQVAYQQRYN